MKNIIILLFFSIISGCCEQTATLEKISDDTLPVPQIEFDPQNYVCYKTSMSLNIDGKLNERDWNNALWTDQFVDIEGDLKPKPYYETRVKMLWDDDYLYIGAKMKEEHIWGKLTKRDAVIYHDNDFEVFIDPDGDTHEYYELEINALGTEWDLLLVKPYRDGAPAVNGWDIVGLKSAVYLVGTINNPNDIDSFWSVELAFPWKILKECAHKDAPPKDNDQWRINFSRVQWETEVINGEYVKKKDSLGNNLSEYNWVWSPQGLIAMHYPEMWGFIQFSDTIAGSGEDRFIYEEIESSKFFLRKIYYYEKTHLMQYGAFTKNIDIEITEENKIYFDLLKIDITSQAFTASLEYEDKIVSINETGKTNIKDKDKK